MHSLMDNPFSSAGLALRRAADAERALARIAERDGPNAAPPALAYAEDEYRLQGGAVRETITKVVHAMGLAYTVAKPAPPPLPALPAATAEPVRAPANDSLLQTSEAPKAPAAPKETAGGGAAPPISALAKLAVLAKANVKLGGPSGSNEAAFHTTVHGSNPRATPPPAKAAVAGEKRSRQQRDGNDVVSDDEDDDDDFAVQLPTGATPAAPTGSSATVVAAATSTSPERQGEPNIAAEAALKHPSQMTREEYLSQFRRAPRRGEVGQSAEEIAKAQGLGYVMSGSRSIGAQMYMDRIQRQLHEREAGKLQQHFRKVEDERMDSQMISGMLKVLEDKIKGPKDPAPSN